ncbi:hypothetical protein D3C72_1728790 [compost metagenome]
MDPYTLVFWIWRKNLLEFILSLCYIQCNLIVSGAHIPLIRVHPNLKKLDYLIGVFIIFTVYDARSGAHDLNISLPDNGFVTHAVFMLQITFQRDTDDFHIVVRVFAKTSSFSHHIII